MTHTSKALFWFTYFHGAFDNIVALNFVAEIDTGITATGLFQGAAAVGDSVYFAPFVSAPRAVPTFAPVCMFAIVCRMRHT